MPSNRSKTKTKSIMDQIPYENLTPMLKQYVDIKKNFTDYILFYRLGDFYEMFMDDAVEAARILEITLTKRGNVDGIDIPLCGVPYHSVDAYFKKAIDANLKIAICEQTEDPAQAKGIVKREVVRIITPGTIFDPDLLDSSANNFIAAIRHISGKDYQFSYCDITTGTVRKTQLNEEQLALEMARKAPAEVIYLKGDIPESLEKQIKFRTELAPEDTNSADSTAMLLEYLAYTSKTALEHIETAAEYNIDDNMVVDPATIKNLELLLSQNTFKKQGSLLWVMDKTETAMGARLLRQSMIEPLLDPEMIEARYDFVEILFSDLMLRSEIRYFLGQIYDIERLITKLVYGSVNPKDLIAIKQSLAAVSDLKRIGAQIKNAPRLFTEYFGRLDGLENIQQLIESAILDDPPANTNGDFLKPGYNEKFDHYLSVLNGGRDWLKQLESREKEATGIKTLKVGFNKVFGYYIEISKAAASTAPTEYIRKQTLVNSERFITEELKDLEQELLSAEENKKSLELQLFLEIVSKIKEYIASLKKTSAAVAAIDMFASIAEVSFANNYCRPVITTGAELEIVGGRHPVIESLSDYIPNDIKMNDESDKLIIITGPNMSGKSSFLRQTMIIQLMAQMGSFVPAASAHLGITDKLFTRVGASDNLAGGQSTFMVEMAELAHILKNITDRSLVILDEIGRGTSTYDGLSIAWAVVEFLSKTRCKTMFATHYHELTGLEGNIAGVQNLAVQVAQEDGGIVFLRNICKGASKRSYGIEVAKLAGVPGPVVARAHAILNKILSQKTDLDLDLQLSFIDDFPAGSGNPKGSANPLASGNSAGSANPQASGNSAGGSDHKIATELLQHIKNINPEDITARDALNILFELCELADSRPENEPDNDPDNGPDNGAENRPENCTKSPDNGGKAQILEEVFE